MKRIVLALTTTALLFTGCGKNSVTITDSEIIIATQTAATLGLNLGIKDPQKRQVVANLLYYCATQVRAFVDGTQNNDPERLAWVLNNNIPANIQQEYPQIIPLVVPLVVTAYQQIYTKYSHDVQKLYLYTNDIAMGLENAAGTYKSQ